MAVWPAAPAIVKAHEPGAIAVSVNAPEALVCGAIAAMPLQVELITT